MMAKKTKKKTEKVVRTYEGVDRVLNGQAVVFREPYEKGDTFAYDNLSVITAAVRDGKPLYAVGQKLEGPAGVFEVVEIEIWTNQHNLCQSEAELEGFAHPAVFAALYEARYGDALYRPAWRIKVNPLPALPLEKVEEKDGESDGQEDGQTAQLR
jgi:hypothetical protein